MKSEQAIRDKMNSTLEQYKEAIAKDELTKAHELDGQLDAYLWVLSEFGK